MRIREEVLANSGNRDAGAITLDRSGHVTRDKIFVHEGPNGFICVGLGPGARLLTLAERAEELPALKRLDPALAEFYDPYLQRLAALAKGYNPDEPRVPAGEEGSGEWTGDGSAGTDSASLTPASTASDHISADKERFVDAHLADAQKTANKLSIPVENILGLSALESGWGHHPFAAQGNNYFGIHYPAPFANGYILAADGRTKVATFSSYSESLRSFVAKSGTIVQGKGDAVDFATALQDSGKFGILSDGSKAPTYIRDVANTIHGLRAVVARRKI